MNNIQNRNPPRLSKSRFIAGMQCPLRLWNDIYRRDLAAPFSETQQAIFDRGTAIGELAQQRYPGGVLVGFKPWEREEAIAETNRLLADPSVPAIYEAALEHEGVFVRVDVLARNGEGWDLVEVKGSTRPEKEVFQRDAAIQYWVATGAGLTIHRAGILVLNRDYVYPGGAYDLDQLFHFGDATEFCQEQLEATGTTVKEFHRLLAAENPPDIGIGEHCFTPYECPYYGACTEGLEFPEHPISDLYRLNGTRREQLEALGIAAIPEIPDDFDLTPMQERIRQVVVSGEPWASSRLKGVLSEPEWPLYYLDFEAWQPALPPYPGMRPFQAIPFQFSVHIESEGGELTHEEYLHEQATDPRRALAERLLETLGTAGSIVVYSGYERRMISALAEHLGDLRDPLLALNARLWDLLPVIRDHYYHPEFRGSFSIKSVLPALVDGAHWSGLSIADGMTAAVAYETAVAEEPTERRKQVFADLRTYCAQDTRAMVDLMRELRNQAEL
ncbi:MAG: DUF2779 domain-containing protein [Xanthomonadales bacterium]|nr:DUF2779 domain-containing protein [Xanthomonadales bacterium]